MHCFYNCEALLQVSTASQQFTRCAWYHLSIKLQDLILTIILIRNLEIVTIFLCRSFWIFSSPKFGSSYEDCWQSWLKASDISTWLHYQLFNPHPSLPASHKGLSICFKIPLWQWLTFYLLPNTHFIWLTCFWANSTDLNFPYCFGYLLTLAFHSWPKSRFESTLSILLVAQMISLGCTTVVNTESCLFILVFLFL